MFQLKLCILLYMEFVLLNKTKSYTCDVFSFHFSNPIGFGAKHKNPCKIVWQWFIEQSRQWTYFEMKNQLMRSVFDRFRTENSNREIDSKYHTFSNYWFMHQTVNETKSPSKAVNAFISRVNGMTFVRMSHDSNIHTVRTS